MWIRGIVREAYSEHRRIKVKDQCLDTIHAHLLIISSTKKGVRLVLLRLCSVLCWWILILDPCYYR